MVVKIGLFVALTLLVGSLAKPTEDERDMSIFFDHTNPDARIVGGHEARDGSVPWMVALSHGFLIKNFLCGASIVTETHLLTAAHCIRAVYSDWTGLSGTLRATVGTNRWMYGGTHYNIARNVSHPNYVHRAIKNDLGFLITRTRIRFSSVISPVSLSFEEIGTDVATTVNGWGHTKVNGATSGRLLELHAATVDGLTCMTRVPIIAAQHNLNPPPVEPHIEICTYHNVDFGTCNGDSGSPLLRRDSRQQIGIVSWGIPCARGAPDMFVRISAYKTWIQNVIAN